MNKADLIVAMAEQGGLTKKDAEKALNSFIAAVGNALSKDEKVQIVGFGSFEVKARAARKGRNPLTGAEMMIPASRTPVFKAGKVLKDSI